VKPARLVVLLPVVLLVKDAAGIPGPRRLGAAVAIRDLNARAVEWSGGGDCDRS